MNQSPKVAALDCGHWGKNLVRNFYSIDTLKLVGDVQNVIRNERKLLQENKLMIRLNINKQHWHLNPNTRIIECMKTITVNISESAGNKFKGYAKHNDVNVPYFSKVRKSFKL